MQNLSAFKNWNELAKSWLKLRSYLGKGFWLGLVALCVVAAISGYEVRFSFTEGFVFSKKPSAESPGGHPADQNPDSSSVKLDSS